MINNKRIIAIIPARGGSKRLPRKNILPLLGKPLINWTIEAALASKYIDDVFVSTDDAEIMSIAQKAGASVPELRPSHLSTDTATTQDVVFYTLQNFSSNQEIVIILQPTSPLRRTYHIDEAIELFIQKNAFSIVAITPCEHSPLWSNILPPDKSMANFVTKEAMNRSQDLKQYYRINGAIYIFNIEKLVKYNEICYTSESFSYIMENKHSIDIDNYLDFKIAEVVAQDSKA